MSRTPFDVLGLPADASLKDIKRAFRKIALEAHPDGSHPDVDRFQEAERAHHVLTNPELRRRYDERGETGEVGPTQIGDEDDLQIQAQVRTVLGMVVDRTNVDVVHSDILQLVSAQLRVVGNDLRGRMKKELARLERIQTIEKRLRRTKGADSLDDFAVKIAFSQLLGEQRVPVEMLEHEFLLYQRTVAVFEAMAYDFEERPPEPQWAAPMDEDPYRQRVLGNRRGGTFSNF